MEAVFTEKTVTVRLTARDGERLSLSGDAAGGMESWSSPRKAAKFKTNGAQLWGWSPRSIDGDKLMLFSRMTTRWFVTG